MPLKHFRIIMCLALLPLLTASVAQSSTKTYAVIVAHNHSLDEGVEPLRFADDDGARYFELFEAAGAETALFSVLDADAQQRFSRAAEAARAPRKEPLLGHIDELFARMARDTEQGVQTNFVFVYAGHGNVGPNREGYVNLLDERLTRSELYSRVIARSPATFNHYILDACHAYFLVNKRGGEPDKTGDYRQTMRDFLRSEELRSYPNTGVILAASSESETHEWSRIESGIFSHELISCMLGAGDVDGDRNVTYDEAAACVEAANAAIDVPKARLQVYSRAPSLKNDEPLLDLASLSTLPRLHLPAMAAGRYHVEDARGVRTLDIHYSAEQPMEIALLGQAPFYLRKANREAAIAGDTDRIDFNALEFQPTQLQHRGSVDQSFRKNLFAVPFGNGFYRGMLANRATEVDEPIPLAAVPEEQVDARPFPWRTLGWTMMSAGALTLGASGGFYLAARSSHDDYNDATASGDASELRETTEDHLTTSRVLLGTGVALVTLGAGAWIYDLVKHKKRKSADDTSAQKRATPFLTAWSDGTMLGLQGEF